MSYKIDRYCIACTLGTEHQQIYNNLINPEKTFLTRSSDYLPERSVYVGSVGMSSCVEQKWENEIHTNNDIFPFFVFKTLNQRVSQLKKQYGCSRIGIVTGTSTAGIYNLENALLYLYKFGLLPEDFRYSDSEMTSIANILKVLFGVTGPSYNISTACTSGIKAIASAGSLLDTGICDAVITGGIDTLCKLTVQGFDSLDLISGDIANPLSANRDGINIAEGAAVCILTREEGGIHIKGIGESCDAYHVSSPHPDGEGTAAAMNMALKKAGLSKGDISYIQLHGTGTRFNDVSEAKAIHSLFGSTTPCSSVKPLVGHTLGTSGSLGALLCALLLEQQQTVLPPHIWDGQKDSSIPDINVISKPLFLDSQAKPNFMVNNLAFGGNNCSIIVGRAD